MVHPADFLTILLLVALEGLLSADNAMVLAVLVLGLPKKEQRKALRYGIIGAFAFRAIARSSCARSRTPENGCGPPWAASRVSMRARARRASRTWRKSLGGRR